MNGFIGREKGCFWIPSSYPASVQKNLRIKSGQDNSVWDKFMLTDYSRADNQSNINLSYPRPTCVVKMNPTALADQA